MREVQRRRLSDNTWSLCSRAIKNHLKPTLGGHNLKELSVGDVRQALKTLEKRKIGVAVARKSLQALSSCLSCAMREELVFRNVAQLVEKPQYTPRETEIWTKEQATYFLRAIKDHPQYVAFLLLFTYGMRRAEVLGLRYSDIDFANKRIHVRQQVARIEGVVAARPLKTKNSRRVLPLIDAVEYALWEHARKQGVVMPSFNPCHEFSTEGTIIVSGTGRPLESVYLPQLFHQLSEKMGLPRIKLHAIRHTTATILKDLNIPLKDVQLMLGHADISTTTNIYQHGTPETHRFAISAVGERLLATH